jgi:hypothetical protein
MALLGIILVAISLLLFSMGFGALKNSANHAQYGVVSEGSHKTFSWIFIVLASALAIGGGWLLAG